jgi:acyl transferase domain-containing protein
MLHASDPQQRLLLESFAMLRSDDHHKTALEPSRNAAASTSGSQLPQSPSAMVGVYVGVSQLEYAGITLQQRVPVNAYYATGMND